MDLLNVVIRADTSGADKADAALGKMTASARGADQAIQGLARGSASASARMAETAQRNARALDQQAQAMQRLAAANDNAAGSTANIAAQFQDIGVTAAMGMNPIMIALQQGTQLSSALLMMQNPIKGLAGAFMAMISPVSLLTIGFVALAAAGIQAFSGTEKDVEQATTALERHNEWLDKILAGYDDVRDAANQAAEAALRLPEASAASELAARQDAALQTYQARMSAFIAEQQKLQDEITDMVRLGGDATIIGGLQGLVDSVADAGINAKSSAEEINALHTQLTQFRNATDDADLAYFASQFLLIVEEARAARAEVDSLGASLNALPSSVVTTITVQMEGFTEARQNLLDLMPDFRDRFTKMRDEAKTAFEGMQVNATDAIMRMAAAEDYEKVLNGIARAEAEYNAQRASKGGVPAAVKEFNQELETLIGTADRLGEKLFPGEYARREAEQLTQALATYGKGLDDLQRQAVEKRIADLTAASALGLRELTEETKAAGNEMADALQSTLGSVLSDLFSKPIRDFDDFLERVLSGFAQLGQQNLGRLFEGVTGNGQGAQAGQGNFFDAIFEGSRAGTESGAQSGLQGLAGLFKNGQMGGLLSAGLGGFGMGAQTANPLTGGLGGAMSGFAAGGPIGGVIGGIAGFLGGLFGMNQELEKAKKKLEEIRPQIEKFVAAANGEVLSQYASALADATTQAKQMIEVANAAKDWATAGAIEQALANLPATLAKEFQKDLLSSIQSLQGNGYLNEIAAAQERYNERLADAAKLGTDGSLALQELNLTIQKIADEAGLSAHELSQLASKFPGLAASLTGAVSTGALDQAVEAAERAVEEARNALRAAYEAEVSELNAVIDRNKQFIRSLEDFKRSLRFDNGISPLAPIDRVRESERAFMDVRQKALAGDQEAIGELEAVSRQYLEDARAYYGTSETYMKIWEQVDATLDQALARATQQVSDAEKQLGTLQSQVGHLIDINNSVLSVADAVRALDLAQKALGTAEQDRTSALVDRLYENVLGREADAKGAAWWGKIIADQGGLTAEIYRQFADRARQNGEVTMPGYAMGGFTGGMEGQIAGYVHGQEFVANAAATRMFRPQLEAMNRGVSPGNDNGALVSELRELRAEVAQLRGTVAAGAQATVAAVGETKNAIASGNRDAGLNRLKKSA